MKTQYNKKFDKQEEALVNQDPIHMDIKENEIPPQQKTPPLATVINCSRLNVRKNPEKNSPILGILDSGTTVLIRNEENQDWTYISAPSGINGYVMSIFIEKVVGNEEV